MEQNLTERMHIRFAKHEMKDISKEADFEGIEPGQWVRSLIRKELRRRKAERVK